MKKFILVLVAVIVAATEISSATEISRECKSREYTYTQSYHSKEELIVRIVKEVLCNHYADTSYLVKDLTSGLTYNYKVDIQGIYENSCELIITVSEDKSSYLVHVNIEYSSPSFYTSSDGVLAANVPARVTSFIVELPIGADPKYRVRAITMSEDKSSYLVHVDEIIENSSIFIYTIDDGMLGPIVPVKSNTVQVSAGPLFKGKTYFVKYSSNDKMIYKDKLITKLSKSDWLELYLKYKFF